MVINRIDGFAAMGRQLLDRFQGTDRSVSGDDILTAESRVSPEESRTTSGDTADISPKAHRLIALRKAMDSGHQALESVPAVRPDRVAEVRARLDRGFYNSVEVRTKVAERLGGVARQLEDI